MASSVACRGLIEGVNLKKNTSTCLDTQLKVRQRRLCVNLCSEFVIFLEKKVSNLLLTLRQKLHFSLPSFHHNL